jgi:DNA polymerase
MKTLHIDIETYSDVDLNASGTDRYCEGEDFDILLFAYSEDSGPVQLIDLASGEQIPDHIIDALSDDNVTKYAHNARFERTCLSRYLDEYLEPESWHCSMVACAYIGLPFSLEAAAQVAGAEAQKMSEGKALIRYFCRPPRHYPQDEPERWALFKEYCKRDVETEIAILEKIKKHPLPDSEWENYVLDQRINDRGILIDTQLVTQALKANEQSHSNLVAQFKELTGLDNPNSPSQIKAWLSQHGVQTETIDKRFIKEILPYADEDVKRVLELRQELAKSSVRKYDAMQNVVCSDGRARGMFQFYGAQRSGRFAGRQINVQNLPQNHLPNLDEARALLRDGHFDAIAEQCGSVSQTLSELIRTAFISKAGCKFICVDFSSIEAVVLAWVTGEDWVLQAYEAKEDLYIRNAERMFNAPPGSVVKGSEMRQKSKIATLACGYAGGINALKAMGALEMGIKEDELQPIVDAWRKANPRIVRLWREVDKAAKHTIRTKSWYDTGMLNFDYRGGMLTIRLPSGRRLYYIKPRIEPNRFGGESITFEGIGTQHKWTRIDTFGAKLVENIIQGIARDVLCDAMQRLERAGLEIVLHCHDECLIEASPGVSVEAVCKLMTRPPNWANDLHLRAEGFEGYWYKKG